MDAIFIDGALQSENGMADTEETNAVINRKLANLFYNMISTTKGHFLQIRHPEMLDLSHSLMPLQSKMGLLSSSSFLSFLDLSSFLSFRHFCHLYHFYYSSNNLYNSSVVNSGVAYSP